MSTLSAWSKVVRLWRSFIASLSSASLRSNITRSVVSSRLQSGKSNWRLKKRDRGGHCMITNSHLTLHWAWKIWLAVLFCLELQVESSAPRWLDREMQGGKFWVLSVCEGKMQEEWASQGPFSRCLSVSCDNRSFNLLLSCSRRFSSTSCRLHRSCMRVHWKEGRGFFRRRGNSVKVFILYVNCTIRASLWPVHIAAGPEAGPHVHHSLLSASTRYDFFRLKSTDHLLESLFFLTHPEHVSLVFVLFLVSPPGGTVREVSQRVGAGVPMQKVFCNRAHEPGEDGHFKTGWQWWSGEKEDETLSVYLIYSVWSSVPI